MADLRGFLSVVAPSFLALDFLTELFLDVAFYFGVLLAEVCLTDSFSSSWV